jgi:hypothetical protein
MNKREGKSVVEESPTRMLIGDFSQNFHENFLRNLHSPHPIFRNFPNLIESSRKFLPSPTQVSIVMLNPAILLYNSVPEAVSHLQRRALLGNLSREISSKWIILATPSRYKSTRWRVYYRSGGNYRYNKMSLYLILSSRQEGESL